MSIGEPTTLISFISDEKGDIQTTLQGDSSAIIRLLGVGASVVAKELKISVEDRGLFLDALNSIIIEALDRDARINELNQPKL